MFTSAQCSEVVSRQLQCFRHVCRVDLESAVRQVAWEVFKGSLIFLFC